MRYCKHLKLDSIIVRQIAVFIGNKHFVYFTDCKGRKGYRKFACRCCRIRSSVNLVRFTNFKVTALQRNFSVFCNKFFFYRFYNVYKLIFRRTSVLINLQARIYAIHSRIVTIPSYNEVHFACIIYVYVFKRSRRYIISTIANHCIQVSIVCAAHIDIYVTKYAILNKRANQQTTVRTCCFVYGKRYVSHRYVFNRAIEHIHCKERRIPPCIDCYIFKVYVLNRCAVELTKQSIVCACIRLCIISNGIAHTVEDTREPITIITSRISGVFCSRIINIVTENVISRNFRILIQYRVHFRRRFNNFVCYVQFNTFLRTIGCSYDYVVNTRFTDCQRAVIIKLTRTVTYRRYRLFRTENLIYLISIQGKTFINIKYNLCFSCYIRFQFVYFIFNRYAFGYVSNSQIFHASNKCACIIELRYVVQFAAVDLQHQIQGRKRFQCNIVIIYAIIGIGRIQRRQSITGTRQPIFKRSLGEEIRA